MKRRRIHSIANHSDSEAHLTGSAWEIQVMHLHLHPSPSKGCDNSISEHLQMERVATVTYQSKYDWYDREH